MAEDLVAALLDFWFGRPGTPECDQPRDIWFEVDPAFDAACAAQFGEAQQRAARGELDGWTATPDAALALVLLLDQMPRNLYRGRPAAFACDAKARAVARRALTSGFDRELPPVRRGFFYLPFEHSEDLADQELSLRLFAALPPSEDHASNLDFARRHHAIIARFGRFPHRNRALGRLTTAEEEAFLKEPNSSF